MAIRDWPQQERPREKLLNKGTEALSDAELLAIFLRTGVAGRSAIDVGRQLLDKFGSLRKLLDASLDDFASCKGIGVAKYAQLQASLEVGRRYLGEVIKQSDTISSPDDTRNYLKARLRHHRREIFACLFLNNQHQIIKYEELFSGTINKASVHPREVVVSSLKHNAAAVIFAHNHPSGVAEPSSSDRYITQCLVNALALVDIKVIDHMIVGEGEVVSMAELGEL